jgi:predicted TIM-barrel fold metal-dependent hydrolase
VLEGAGAAAGALVERLGATFGAERLVWGSDYPQTHDRTYAELVALGRDSCAGLPPADQAGVLGENALRLWPSLAR